MVGSQARVHHVLDPISARIADEYARGLLETIEDDDRAERSARQLDELVRIWAQLDGGQVFLAAVLSDRQRAASLVEKAFAGRVCEPIEALLALLARNGRLVLLGRIAEAFRRRLYERQGKLEVVVTTAIRIGDAQIEQLRYAVERSVGRKIILQHRVDPRICGGLKVQIGDKVYDASIDRALRDLRRRLKVRLGAEQTGGDAG